MVKDALALGTKVGAVILCAGASLVGVQLMSDVYDGTKESLKSWRAERDMRAAERHRLIADAKNVSEGVEVQEPATGKKKAA